MSSSSTDANDGCKYNIDDITEDLGEAIIAKDEDKIVDVSTTEQACAANNDDKGDIIDTKADNDDSVKCSLCGWGQTKKICISCAQKIELAKILEQALNNDTQNNNTDTCSIEQDELDGMSTCAECGKEGDSDEMNNCNKCKMVKYCNAACKKKHRKKHKKACEGRVAELHDEQLFKEPPPPNEECPICMLPLPLDLNQIQFQNCCGKRICVGCIYGMVMSNAKNKEDKICPYCRTPGSSTEDEDIKRIKKLIENGNIRAMSIFATNYAEGRGIPQDFQKASELWLQAGEQGCAVAYFNLGLSYDRGRGVDIDKEKAKYYYELAAMGGDLDARRNLGRDEYKAGNHHRAFKHMMIAAKAGDKECLNVVKTAFMKFGSVTKDDYESTLRCYHERQKEMKSDARDKGAILMADMIGQLR